MRERISFRPVNDDDLGFLSRVYAATRQEELAMTGWPQAQIDEFLQQQFEAQHGFYMQTFREARFDIVVFDGTDIGRLYVDRRGDEIRIIDIALLPENRGQGIGTTLMRELLDEGQAGGLPVRIHVERDNPAQSLYRRLGFHRIEDQGVYWLMEKPAATETAC